MTDATLEMDEDRYKNIVMGSRIPAMALLNESIKEDRLLLLPRALRLCLRTMRRMPHALFMHPGPDRDRYVYHTLEDCSRRICHLAQIRLEVRGREGLEPGRTYLFAVNHSSPSDIPVLYATLPAQAAFVANGLFTKVPVFSFWMRKSGAVFFDKGDRKAAIAVFRAMVKRLKKGRSLILFPEGFMHQGEGLEEFKRGGIHTAVLAGVPIVPVCLYGTARVIPIGSMHIRPRQRVTVDFGEPIETATLCRDGRKGIDAIVRERLLAMKAAAAEEARRWAPGLPSSSAPGPSPSPFLEPRAPPR